MTDGDDSSEKQRAEAAAANVFFLLWDRSLRERQP